MSGCPGPAWIGAAYYHADRVTPDRVPGQPNNYREKMALYANTDPQASLVAEAQSQHLAEDKKGTNNDNETEDKEKTAGGQSKVRGAEKPT